MLDSSQGFGTLLGITLADVVFQVLGAVGDVCAVPVVETSPAVFSASHAKTAQGWSSAFGVEFRDDGSMQRANEERFDGF